MISWALPILGATLIITCSTLIKPFRDFLCERYSWLYELSICPMCTGFWVGAAASGLGWSLVGFTHLGLLRVFGDACAAAWCCWASHVLLCMCGQGRMLSARPDLKNVGRLKGEQGQ